jgi:hypothetical protein
MEHVVVPVSECHCAKNEARSMEHVVVPVSECHCAKNEARSMERVVVLAFAQVWYNRNYTHLYFSAPLASILCTH